MYVFSGKDVSVYIQLTDTPVVQGEVFPRQLQFLPVIYLDSVSVVVSKGVDFVWVIGRRNIGGVIPVSLPPASVSLNFPFIDDDQLYLILASLQRRPHKKFVQMKMVFSPDLFGREFVLEFQNGMTRDVDINLSADRWGTCNVSLNFPFTLLHFTREEYQPLRLSHPPLPKGYRTVFEFYPEGSDKPLDWLSAGAVSSLKFSLITEINFDYTFPSLFSFFPKPNPYIPYNSPSSISEGRYYIQGNITVLYPPTWAFQIDTQGGITGTFVDQGTVVLRMLDASFNERLIWYLYGWTPKNFNFNVSLNDGVRFTSDFIALNFEIVFS